MYDSILQNSHLIRRSKQKQMHSKYTFKSKNEIENDIATV